MSKPDAANMRSLIRVDKHRLDQECEEQAELFFDHAEALAEADFQKDEAEAALEVAEAEAEQDVRNHPKRFGLKEPIREGSIKGQVVLHPAVRKATRLLNLKKRNAAIVKAAVNALDQRKRMLEKLVDLHGRDYFARPAVNGVARPSRRKGAARDT